MDSASQERCCRTNPLEGSSTFFHVIPTGSCVFSDSRGASSLSQIKADWGISGRSSSMAWAAVADHIKAHSGISYPSVRN